MDTLNMMSAPSEFMAEIIAQGIENRGIDRVLKTIRIHLEMDVAFISCFRKEDRLLEHVDGGPENPLAANMVIPLQTGYCEKVVQGILPEFIPDTSLLPAAMAIPETQLIPIGSHLSVPIRLENGDVYGTLCCFSYKPNPSLNQRDMNMMRAFAEVLASHIDENMQAIRLHQAAVSEIRGLIAHDCPRMVFQPIYQSENGKPTGIECLSRFDAEPLRSPDLWFEAAHAAGVGIELELQSIRKALLALTLFPDSIYISINVSPPVVMTRRLIREFEHCDASRIVLELTEHTTVSDYVALNDALAPLRARGVRLAIDDAGAGYASMRHILNLKPDIIKLDLSLTRDIDKDRSRQALAKGLISFAHDIRCTITAEGVETQAEFDTLRRLGSDTVQGYYFSYPLDAHDAVMLLHKGNRVGESTGKIRDMDGSGTGVVYQKCIE